MVNRKTFELIVMARLKMHRHKIHNPKFSCKLNKLKIYNPKFSCKINKLKIHRSKIYNPKIS